MKLGSKLKFYKLFKNDSQRVAFLLCVALRCVALRLAVKVVCRSIGIALLTPLHSVMK